MKDTLLNEIIKDYEFFRYKHNMIDVLRDSFCLIANTISNQVDLVHYDQRENEYLEIIKKYSKEEQEQLTKIFAKLILLCDTKDGVYNDYLGQIFMRTDTNSKVHGQFFTPYHISRLMANISLTSTDLSKDVITANDPCCGAGGLMIALADELARKNVSVSDRLVVVAQDIDQRCVHMAYIQFSLMGIPAVVMKGNSLTQEYTDIWKTPAYYHNYEKFEKALHQQKKD